MEEEPALAFVWLFEVATAAGDEDEDEEGGWVVEAAPAPLPTEL